MQSPQPSPVPRPSVYPHLTEGRAAGTSYRRDISDMIELENALVDFGVNPRDPSEGCADLMSREDAILNSILVSSLPRYELHRALRSSSVWLPPGFIASHEFQTREAKLEETVAVMQRDVVDHRNAYRRHVRVHGSDDSDRLAEFMREWMPVLREKAQGLASAREKLAALRQLKPVDVYAFYGSVNSMLRRLDSVRSSLAQHRLRDPSGDAPPLTRRASAEPGARGELPDMGNLNSESSDCSGSESGGDSDAEEKVHSAVLRSGQVDLCDEMASLADAEGLPGLAAVLRSRPESPQCAQPYNPYWSPDPEEVPDSQPEPEPAVTSNPRRRPRSPSPARGSGR